MLRILEVSADGRQEERRSTDDALTTLEFAPRSGGGWFWIDCTEPSREELSLLAERLALHPATIEDCARVDHRPKFEAYDEYLFVVIHALVRGASSLSDEFEVRELHAFLSGQFLVTVHNQSIASVDAVFRRLRVEPQAAKRGPAFAYYLVADGVVTSIIPWLEDVVEKIEDLEDDLLAPGKGQLSLTAVYRLRRLLGTMRRYLGPEREVFSVLARPDLGIIGKKNGPFFRMIYDEVLRTTEVIESARDHIGNLREMHATQVSQRTNEVVKRLTILSAVFMPLTFLTGFFGQNFRHLPFDSLWLMLLVVLGCVLGPPVMLLWMRSRGWLS